MALTLTSSPSGLAFIKNGIYLEWSSDLFPINTVDSAWAIIADGYTAGGQYYIDVSNSATELITGRHIQFFESGNVVAEAQIISTSVPSNRRLLLNIDRPDSGTTVQRYYKDYAAEVELQYTQPINSGYEDITGIRSALLLQDLSTYLESVWQPYTLGQDASGIDRNAIYFRYRFREVYETTEGTWSAYSTAIPALNGGLQDGQTLSEFTLDGATKRFMTNRPDLSYAVDGETYPLPAYIETQPYTSVDATYGTASVAGPIVGLFPYTSAKSGDEQSIEVMGNPVSRSYVLLDNPFLCREAITIGWLNPYGRSEAFTFVGRQTQRKTSSKGIAMTRFNRDTSPVANSGVLSNYKRLQQIIDKEVVYTANSGYVTREMLEWLSEIVLSDYVWIQDGANVTPILVTTSEVVYSDTAAKTFELSISYVKSSEVVA
jgi:hypothetical protein